MSKLKVVQAPAEVLNQVAKPVTFKEPKLQKLLLDMEETLVNHKDPPGVGLAAPQVGVSLRIFLALLNSDQKTRTGKVEFFINPEILEISGDSSKSKSDRSTAEGCLSLKKYYGKVNRATKVKIRYQTIDLDHLRENPQLDLKKSIKTKTVTYTDFEARIMQHEVDHLNGRLFTSRIIEQNSRLFEIKKHHGEEEWVEVELG